MCETVVGPDGYGTNGAVPAPINAFIPVAGEGLVTFDGYGNLSASETVNLGGRVVPVNLPGTYRVNSDCTGTLTTANAHLNLVIVLTCPHFPHGNLT